MVTKSSSYSSIMYTREYHKRLESHYKYQTWLFRLLALWKLPDSMSLRFRTIHKIYFIYMLIFWILSFNVSCFIQVMVNITDLNEVIKVFFIFATALAVLSKFATIKLKNSLYYELVQRIHGPLFCPINEREEILFKRAESLSRTVRNLYCGLSLFALELVLVTQLFMDNMQLPLSIYNPINIDKKWKYFMIYLYQYIAVSICCFMNIAFDSLAASFLIHIKGQLDILCDRLENLGSNEYAEEDLIITLQLKNCIKYYAEIRRIAKIVENLISFPISIQIACSVLVLVANFYAMTFLSDPGDHIQFLKILIYQLCMLSQIYILCYFSNEVTLKCQEIPYYLYCAKWVNWNKLNRKLTLLMMINFGIPIRIRSLNPTVSFNLETFASIVNASYSYFALLKRFNS